MRNLAASAQITRKVYVSYGRPMAKTCFCGCGETLPRFTGRRGMSRHGRKLAEVIAYAAAIHESFDDDYDDLLFPRLLPPARDRLDEFRDYAHGQLEPEDVDVKGAVGLQKALKMWSMNARMANASLPDMATWLYTARGEARVRLVCAGSYQNVAEV
jgi:hypothetical protein